MTAVFAQGLPFTLSPRILYRGLGAALTNEMGQMGLQFGVTGFLKKLTMSSADEVQHVTRDASS